MNNLYDIALVLVAWIINLVSLYPYASLIILFLVFLSGMFSTTRKVGVVDSSYRSYRKQDVIYVLKYEL